MAHRIRNGFIGLVLGYIALLIYLTVIQDQLLYHPDKTLSDPSSYGFSGEAVTIQTKDRVKLTVWQKLNPDAHTAILFFHGNAENLGTRAKKLQSLVDAGFSVVAVSSRGYGGSQGQPSQQGFYQDADAAIVHLNSIGVHPADLIVYGESIGTHTALYVASEYPVLGVFLEAPFTSIADVAQEIYWYVPVSPLLRDHFDSRALLEKVNEPIWIVHQEGDTVVPHRYGQALFGAAKDPKHLSSHAGSDHTFSAAVIVQEMQDFVSSLEKTRNQ